MTKKRILCAVLASMLAPGAVSATVNAQDVTAEITADYEEDGIKYELLDDYTYMVVEIVDKTKTEIVIPSNVNSRDVTMIGITAFSGCTQLTHITIPDTVTGIGIVEKWGDSIHWTYGIFDDCTSLESISYKGQEYTNTTGIYYIVIANAVYENGFYVADNAIFYCDSYNAEEIVIPDGITTIESYAFKDCTGFKSITLPESIELIDLEVNPFPESLTDVYYKGTQEQWNKVSFKYIYLSAGGIAEMVGQFGDGKDYSRFNGMTPQEYMLRNAILHFIDGSTSGGNTNTPTTPDPTPTPTPDPTPTPTPETSAPESIAPESSFIKKDDNTSAAPDEVTEPTEFKPVLSDEDGALDEETKAVLGGITVIDSNGAFDDGVVMNVSFIEKSDDMFRYDITFTDENGSEIQPKCPVTVKVPIPEFLKGGDIYVYHIDDNGNRTLVPSKVENGYVIFEADHFSAYELSDVPLDTESSDTTRPGTSNPASNPNTGIGYAFVPVFIAAGAVIVSASKKRK